MTYIIVRRTSRKATYFSEDLSMKSMHEPQVNKSNSQNFLKSICSHDNWSHFAAKMDAINSTLLKLSLLLNISY